MGVTYKLKQEIIDFIIEKKRAEPSVSCRKLAMVLQEVFHLEISKSSINAVLKGSSLSSPVGRTPGPDADVRKKAPKNFLIPLQKKEQLFAQVVPFLGGLPATTEIKEPEVPKSPEALVTEEMEAPQEEAPEPVEALSLSADILARKAEPVSITPEAPPSRACIWDGDRGPLLGQAGYILIRAVMQDIMRRPSLGYVLARAAGIDLTKAALLEAVLFSRAMGVDLLNAVQESSPDRLWKIFDAEPQPAEALITGFLGKNIPIRSLAMALESELMAAGICVDTLKCVADTGEHFCLSADLGRVLPGETVSGGRPVLKAIELVVDGLVGTEKLIMFDQNGVVDQSFCEFLMFLDGATTYKLDKIELWSMNRNLIWSTVVSQSKNIKFIANIPQFVGNIEITGNALKTEFFDPNFGERYILAEGRCKPDEHRSFMLRAIDVTHQNSSERTVLLTNIPQEEASAVQLMEKYLHRMSNIRKISDNNDLNPDLIMSSMAFDMKAVAVCQRIESLLTMTFDLLKKRSREFLLGVHGDETIMDDILNVPGHIRHEKTAIHVLLVPEPGFSRVAALRGAVDIVNRSCMTDYEDRKYQFSILSSDKN